MNVSEAEVTKPSGWLIDPKQDLSMNHWVDLRFVEGTDEGDQHWFAASVKWDGCIHFHKAYNYPFGEFAKNEPEGNQDYIHICDLDDYIEKLIALRVAAKKYFAYHEREWPDL